MFAVLVVHPTQPGLLTSDRERLLAANAPWQEFLRRQPGFREFVVIGDAAADRVVALSLWESEAHFRAMLDNPEGDAAAAGFAGLFTAPTQPETYEVLAYERA